MIKNNSFTLDSNSQFIGRLTLFKSGIIKYKKFGKEVKIKGETIVELTGKTVQIGIKLKAEYSWNKEDAEVDKTEYRTDRNGDIAYKKELDSVFNVDGFSAEEMLTEAEEAKSIETKRKYLESDKAIYHPELEEAEIEESESNDSGTSDELDFWYDSNTVR